VELVELVEQDYWFKGGTGLSASSAALAESKRNWYVSN